MPERGAFARSPRVVFVDHSGLPGGGQLGLARYLRSTRLEDVHVIVLSPGDTFREVEKSRGFTVEVLSDGTSARDLFRTRRALGRRLREIDPDLIIANSNKSALVLSTLANRSGAERIYYMRDDLNPGRKGLAKRLVLSRWMMPRYDRIIANSRWTASTIPTASLKNRTTIAYPVSGIAVAEGRTPVDENEPLRILSLSRIARWKGIHVLLEAAQLLEDRGLTEKFTLTIAGSSTHEDPEYELNMWRTAQRIASSVDFPGHVEDTGRLLRDHDVLVACSISPEPFGQVVVQGLAHGLVAIASAEGGPAEVIENEVDGYLLPPGDAHALALLLETLITDIQGRREMSRAAVKAATRFMDPVTIDALDDVLIGLQ